MRRLRIGPKILRVRDEPEPPPTHPDAPPPICLIHGAGMSGVVWTDAVRKIAPSRRVLAPDLPGHGQSNPWHEQSIDLYRDAVGTMCAHLKVPKIVVVGHSMGGAVALRCALAWPERISALVLVSSAARLDVPDELWQSLPRELPEGDDTQVEAMPPSLAALAFSPATHRDVRERWQAVAMQASRKTVIGDFALCHRLDLRAPLAKLNMPTLLMGGSDDLLVSKEQLSETQRGIAGAEMLLLPDAGHLPMLEQPGPFVAAIRDFVQSVR